jgi:hypothetical protein
MFSCVIARSKRSMKDKLFSCLQSRSGPADVMQSRCAAPAASDQTA